MSIDYEAKEAVRALIQVFIRNSMRGFFKSSKAQGLSVPQMGALFQIRRQSRAGISHLGEELGVSSAAASQMLDKLVQLGFVVRTEDKHDRRAKTIELTDRGREALRTSIEARQEWVVSIIERMSEEEKGMVKKAFEIMVEKAKETEEAEECCDSVNI